MPSQQKTDSERARRSFYEFVKQAWHVIEPKRRYIDGWHIAAICLHLQALFIGTIQRLIINVPPRHMKSLLVSVFFPAWVWIHRAEAGFMYTAYAQSLSKRDSVKCRRLMESRWYRERWGGRFKFASDQNEKMRYENNQGGVRFATSIEGNATGEGGDFLGIDDPHKIEDKDSPTAIEKANDWIRDVWGMRDDSPDTREVLVMQRLSTNDATAQKLKEGDWIHLKLPIDKPSDAPVTPIGWKDPRTKIGELLWPNKYNATYVAKKRRLLGTHGSAGQLDQEPFDREGALIERAWLPIVKEKPPTIRAVRYWDFAATEQDPRKRGHDPDFTAGLRLEFCEDELYYVTHVKHVRLSPLRLKHMVRRQTKDDGHDVTVFWEEEGGASGKMASDEFRRQVFKGYRARANRETLSKIARADTTITAAENRDIRIYDDGTWDVQGFLNEICSMPNAIHDDRWDALTGALRMIKRNRLKVYEI